MPLNENLPQPVIDLPIPDDLGTEADPLPLAAEAQPEYHRTQLPTPLMATRAGAKTSEEPVNPTIRRRRQPGSPSPLDDDTYELVKVLLTEEGIISSPDVQELIGLNTVAVRSVLKRLVDEFPASEWSRRARERQAARGA
jgi:hypothetical protein